MFLTNLNLNGISSTDKIILDQLDNDFSLQKSLLESIFTLVTNNLGDVISGNVDNLVNQINDQDVDAKFENFESTVQNLWGKLDKKTQVLIANQTDILANNFINSVNLTPYINSIEKFSFVPEIGANIDRLKTELPSQLKEGFTDSLYPQILELVKDQDIDFTYASYFSADYDPSSIYIPYNDSVLNIEYNKNYADIVGGSQNGYLEIDYQDNFSFTPQNANIQLNFKDLVGEIKVDLLDSTLFNIVGSQVASLSKPIVFSNLNTTQPYQLRFVSNSKSINPTLAYYDFSLSNVTNSTTSTDKAENYNVTKLSYSKTGKLSSTNTTDLYTFKLAKSSKMSFNLTNLNQNADLILLDSSDKKVASSGKTGKNADKITKTLSAGSYTLQVVRKNTEKTDTSYKLSIASTTKNALGFTKQPALVLDQVVQNTSSNGVNLNLPSLDLTASALSKVNSAFTNLGQSNYDTAIL